MMESQAQRHYREMTESDVNLLIIRFAIPSTISMLISNFYNMVDTAFVGRLGTSASGAVGCVFGFMAFVQAVGFLFGQGSGSIVARMLGQKRQADASKIASTGFFTSLLLGILIGICGFVYKNRLICMLGSTETMRKYVDSYLTYILLATPFMTASYTMNTILRYEGKSMFAMKGMMAGAILNIFGDLLLMFRLNMGVAGAGLSTAVSQLVGFTILLFSFIRGRTQCRLSMPMVSRGGEDYYDIITTGLPSMVRQALTSISTIMLNTAASAYGDAAVSAMSIVSRIMYFVFSVALGIGQGFQPVCGLNYGAGKYKRVREAFRRTFLLATVSMTLLTLAVLISCEPLLRLFRDDAEVIAIGTRALRLQAVTQLFLPICMAAELLYQSTGHRFGALILSIMRNGLFMIPALLILSRWRGLFGIQEAYPLACILSFFPSVLLAAMFFKKLPQESAHTPSG